MSHRALYCYDHVNRPFAEVSEAVLANPRYVFRHATGATHAHDAALHVDLAGIELGTEAVIDVTGVERCRESTTLTLAWQAVRHPHLFPELHATLVIAAVAPQETRLEVRGTYEPPLGRVGEVLDAVAGHRVAEAVVDRFVHEIAGWLREELAS